MLLSLYASYHWAKMGKTHYVLRMAVFIILVSFVPAISPFPFGMFMPLPIFVSPVLSFPFYSFMGSHPIWLGELEGWIRYCGIGFLTMTSTAAIDVSFMDFAGFSFCFFLLVNVVGAKLGYEMSKIRRIREWGTSTYWNLLGFVLGITFLGGAFIAGSWYDGVENAALFLFGILVLAIVIGRILRSKISETGTPFLDKLLELQEQMDKGVITQQEHEQRKRKLLERLAELKEHLSSGYITQKEYEQKKRKLLEKSEA